MEKEKNGNGLIVLIVIFSLLVLCLGGWMIYDKVTSNKEEPKQEEVTGYKGLKVINTSNYTYNNSCKDEWKYLVNETNVISKTLKNENSVIHCVDYDINYLLYSDNNQLKIYDNINDKYYLVYVIYNNGTDYYLETYENKLIGILVSVSDDEGFDNKESFYSLIDGKNIETKNEYTYMRMLNNKLLAGERFENQDSENSVGYSEIINIDNGNIILSEKKTTDDSYVYKFDIIDGNPNYIGLENKCQATCSDYYSKIYTKDLKLISDNFDLYNIDKDNNVKIYKDNKVTTYNSNGNIIKEDKLNRKVINTYHEYILYLENNEIVLYDHDIISNNFGKINNDDNVLYGEIDEEGVDIFVKNNNVTIDDIWKDLGKKDAYNIIEENPFVGYTKDELKEAIKNNDCDSSYRYGYKFETGEETKNASVYCGW